MHLLFAIVQGTAYIAIAPLVYGLVEWVKARLQRREGPSALQVYRDLRKMLRKRATVPESMAFSWMYTLGPIVAFACYGSLGFVFPVFFVTSGQPVSTSAADLLMLAYLVGLARVMLGLASLDTASPLAGLGTSRDLFLFTLSEPVLLFIICTFAIKLGSTNLDNMVMAGQQLGGALYLDPSMLLLLLPASLIVVLLESDRMPFDNLGAHLELTMLGQAGHLEYGGPQLAFIRWGHALRLTFFSALFMNIFFPYICPVIPAISEGTDAFSGLISQVALGLSAILVHALVLAILCLVLAAWEVSQVKLRVRALVVQPMLGVVLTLIAAIFIILTKSG